MRVGVLGSGNVGKAMASGFASRGHDVRIGSRSGDVEAAPKGVETGTSADVAGHGELVTVAVKGDEFREDGPPTLFVGHDDSGGERLQRQVPDALVVKALNIVNFADMVDPEYPDGRPTMFIAGDDGDAKATVGWVLADFGWDDVIDVGGIEGARLLESLCLLWVVTGVSGGQFGHAFKPLTR